MNWYGYMTPDSTNDGMMKNTETNTACADVYASVDTKTPIASDATTNGMVTRINAIQLPCGHSPKSTPAVMFTSTNTPKATSAFGRSFPSTSSIGVVGDASICS